MGVAVISILSGPFWHKNQLFRPLHCRDMAQNVAGIYCKLYHYLYTKWAENFPVATSTTKCVNISVSTQPFFTKQGPFYSQLDNQSYDHTIMELSEDIKIGPESLLVGFSDAMARARYSSLKVCYYSNKA